MKLTLTRFTVAALVVACLNPAYSQRRRGSFDFELSREDIQRLLNQGEAAANGIASGDGLRSNTVAERGPIVKRPTRMHIAVVERDGKLVGLRSMADAWVGSEDIAIAKARSAAFFSSDENALTSRIIGELSQLTTGSDGKIATGPLWGIGSSNQQGATGGKETRNGLITFPGGVAIYKNGRLIGGVGVSGDAVDQDEAVALGAAVGFEPGANAVKLGYKAPSVPRLEPPPAVAPVTGAPASAVPGGPTTTAPR
ncbi:MAG: GlcG/HbpS family heme-binding protein [Candidatus Sumerlaeaceae bacterium]